MFQHVHDKIHRLINPAVWTTAVGLMAVDLTNLTGPRGDCGRAAVLVGVAGATRVVIHEVRALRRAYDTGIGRAYNLGQRHERRLAEAEQSVGLPHENVAAVHALRGRR